MNKYAGIPVGSARSRYGSMNRLVDQWITPTNSDDRFDDLTALPVQLGYSAGQSRVSSVASRLVSDRTVWPVPLGIHHGIDTSQNLGQMARRRGVEVTRGEAEHLPYRAGSFDFVPDDDSYLLS